MAPGGILRMHSPPACTGSGCWQGRTDQGLLRWGRAVEYRQSAEGLSSEIKVGVWVREGGDGEFQAAAG